MYKRPGLVSIGIPIKKIRLSWQGNGIRYTWKYCFILKLGPACWYSPQGKVLTWLLHTVNIILKTDKSKWNGCYKSHVHPSVYYICLSVCPSWWCHQMETFSVLLALCVGNSPVTGEFCAQIKGQWHGALMFSLICAWINAWENNCEAGDLRCHHAHYDVIAMINHVHPSVCLSVYISWMLKYGWCCKGTILWLFIPWTNEIDYDLFRQSHVHFTITYFPKRSWYTDP